jgi:hypothetical protein
VSVSSDFRVVVFPENSSLMDPKKSLFLLFVQFLLVISMGTTTFNFLHVGGGTGDPNYSVLMIMIPFGIL